jgi:hypothetical protein
LRAVASLLVLYRESSSFRNALTLARGSVRWLTFKAGSSSQSHTLPRSGTDFDPSLVATADAEYAIWALKKLFDTRTSGQ